MSENRKKIIEDLQNSEFRSSALTQFGNKYGIKDIDILDLNTTIHLKDGMLGSSLEYYLYCGFDAINLMRNASNLISYYNRQKPTKPKSILDFPCGYGRVLRWLKLYYPDSDIHGIDLIDNAIDFSSKELGCTSVPAHKDMGKYEFPVKYDLIWSGSLFTHISETNSNILLTKMINALNSNGVLVLTLHGDYVYNRLKIREKLYNLNEERINTLLKEYEEGESGFSFVDYPDTEGYGISINSYKWFDIINDKIIKPNNAEILYHIPKGWVKHQDVLCIRKLP